MDVTFQTLLLGSITLCALTVGIFWTCRGQGIGSGDAIREALMWGGGFIIYAVIDYSLLMR